MPGEGTEAETTQPAAGGNTGNAEAAEETLTVESFKDAGEAITKRLQRFMKNTVLPLQQEIDRLKAAQTLDDATAPDQPAKAEGEAAKPETDKAVEAAQKSESSVEFKQLKAAFDAGLPQNAVALITATDDEGIARQVEVLKSLNPRGPRITSPIPPVEEGATAQRYYKQSELRDGRFMRENREDIQKAYVEGRILLGQ